MSRKKEKMSDTNNTKAWRILGAVVWGLVVTRERFIISKTD